VAAGAALVPVANSGLGLYPGSAGPLTPWRPGWIEVGPVLFTELLDTLEARDLEGRELDARDVIRKVQRKIPHTLADTFRGSCYRNSQNNLFNVLHRLAPLAWATSPNDFACREFNAPNWGGTILLWITDLPTRNDFTPVVCRIVLV
jgi:hypothetical protein